MIKPKQKELHRKYLIRLRFKADLKQQKLKLVQRLATLVLNLVQVNY